VFRLYTRQYTTERACAVIGLKQQNRRIRHHHRHHHPLPVDRSVAALSKSHCNSLPSLPRIEDQMDESDLQFSIIFAILLFFILVTCRSQIYLYLLILSSTGCTFISSKTSSFLLWSKRATDSSSEKFHLDCCQ
jgi:hypothetical protein